MFESEGRSLDIVAWLILCDGSAAIGAWTGFLMLGFSIGLLRGFRVQVHLSNRRVDLINERYDIAFRIQSNFETDQSLTMRKLGSSHLVLVAEPSLLAGRIIRTPEDLALLPTVSMGEHMDRDRWDLVSAAGEERSHVHAPRLCCEDLGMLRASRSTR